LPAARSLLLCDDARLQAFLPRAKLSAYLDRMSRDFSAYRVWSLLVLEHWLRTHPFAVGAPMAPAMAAPAPPKRSLFQAVKRALRA
jgi:asparagine synthase (glutamine-hydrolysing)